MKYALIIAAATAAASAVACSAPSSSISDSERDMVRIASPEPIGDPGSTCEAVPHQAAPGCPPTISPDGCPDTPEMDPAELARCMYGETPTQTSDAESDPPATEVSEASDTCATVAEPNTLTLRNCSTPIYQYSIVCSSNSCENFGERPGANNRYSMGNIDCGWRPRNTKWHGGAWPLERRVTLSTYRTDVAAIKADYEASYAPILRRDCAARDVLVPGKMIEPTLGQWGAPPNAASCILFRTRPATGASTWIAPVTCTVTPI